MTAPQENKSNLVSPENPNKAKMTSMPTPPKQPEAQASSAAPKIPEPPAEPADPDAPPAPPKDPPSTKKVEIKALRAILLSDGTSLAAGQRAFVSEEDAKEFCDKTFTGKYAFGGERENNDEVPRNKIKRAERLH